MIFGHWSMVIFLNGVFSPNPARKERVLIFGIEKNPFYTSKGKLFKKSKKLKLSKGVSPCILAKNDHFSHFRFLGKSSQKRTFLILVLEKRSFYTRKVKFKKLQKIRIFQRG